MLQKRALRIISKKTYLYPTNELFISHKLLKFRDIVREQSIMVLLAFINGNLPEPVSGLFKYEERKNVRNP